MVVASQYPKLYVNKVKDVGEIPEVLIQCSSCNTTITFTNDDLLLGSKPYNCLLFVIGYIKEWKVNTSSWMES